MSADTGRELFDRIHSSTRKPPSESMRVGALLHTDPDTAYATLAERSEQTHATRAAEQEERSARARALIASIDGVVVGSG